jgi:hypothetical protein
VDAEGWNRRYATGELLWSAEPNRGPQRRLARPSGLGGHCRPLQRCWSRLGAPARGAEQRRTVYRNAAGPVAPGGTLLIVGHDTTNLTDVVADLDSAGLTIRRAEAVQRTVATDDGDRVAVGALVRGERPA